MAGPRRLEESFVHLGLGATAVPQPAFAGGMEWYEGYGARHGEDGREGRLVSQYSFTEDWPSRRETVALEAGDYAINPPGVWHIADVFEPATAIFITAGEGTEHRPR